METTTRWTMQENDLDQILIASLLTDAAEGLTAVAMELASLYDGWVARGDCAEAVLWMKGLLEQLGWWAGRLECASDPTLAAKLPRLD